MFSTLGALHPEVAVIYTSHRENRGCCAQAQYADPMAGSGTASAQTWLKPFEMAALVIAAAIALTVVQSSKLWDEQRCPQRCIAQNLRDAPRHDRDAVRGVQGERRHDR